MYPITAGMKKTLLALARRKGHKAPPNQPEETSSNSSVLKAESCPDTDPSSSESTPIPSFPDGVKVLHSCPDATIDVCFVHGLTGDRERTWTAKGQSAPWPQTLLPPKLNKARILTYGYDAYIVRKGVTGSNRLINHATNLLHDLTADRAGCKASCRPLIFVAHSLGGLVCKMAIHRSQNSHAPYLRTVFECTKGIIFIGTPHRGACIADWAKIPVSALGFWTSANPMLLDVLQKDSQLLESIRVDFLDMIRTGERDGRSIEIACFFEELPLPIFGKVVSKESATLEGYSSFSIRANHRDMVRFSSAEDNGFKRLLGELIRWESQVDYAGDPRLSQLLQDCLKSLAFQGMENRFHDIDIAAKGTCEWLLHHETYTNWATCDDRGLLWIKGKPGSGKSTLLKHALDNYEARDGTLVLSFFFHGRGDELQQTPLGLFRSLLYQVLQQAPDAPQDLVNTFQQRSKERGKPGEKWQWHQNELWEFFKMSLPKVLRTQSVSLFIDALDESGEKVAVDLVRRFKDLLQELPPTDRNHVRICFTCRHYPILSLDGAFEICLDQENQEDISTYVQARFSEYRALTACGIPALMISHTSGVFMWTRLVIERVLELERDGESLKKIKTEILSIPQELNNLYRELIHSMGLASLKLIQWVCFATRSLSMEELGWAMAIDPDCPHWSLQACQSSGDYEPDSTRLKRRVQTLSRGLVEITSDTQVVQFIHQSVKDFFLEKGLASLDTRSTSTISAVGNAHHQLSRICIRYLAMEEIGMPMTNSRNVIMREFPLLHYTTTS